MRECSRFFLDARDQAFFRERFMAFCSRPGYRVGDYVDFVGGVTRRISHIWREYPCPLIQTSDGGSFYFGLDGCDFSGGLYPPIPAHTLSMTGEEREGSVWFFHHNRHEGGNGVTTTLPFRVFRCTLGSPDQGRPAVSGGGRGRQDPRPPFPIHVDGNFT